MAVKVSTAKAKKANTTRARAQTKKHTPPPLKSQPSGFQLDLLNIVYNDPKVRFIVMPVGRGSGKSHAAAFFGLALWSMAAGKYKSLPSREIWNGAPTYDLAKRIYVRYSQVIPDKHIARKLDSRNEIRMIDGTLLRCRTEDAEWIGEQIIGAMVDEFGSIMDPEKKWHQELRPALAKLKGKCLFIGTPRGKNNLFYDFYQYGWDSSKPEWKSIGLSPDQGLPSSQSPYHNLAEIASMRADMPEYLAQQELDAMFLDDALAIFRNVQACGTAILHLEPKPGTKYVAGVDLGKSQDWTVVTIIDANTMEVAYFRRFHQISWEAQVKEIVRVVKQYNAGNALLVDSTGVGDPVLEQIQKHLPRAEGYLYTNATKATIIEGLVMAFDDKRIRIPSAATWPELHAELSYFEYKRTPSGRITYNAKQGKHDDCVNSLALAVHQAQLHANRGTTIINIAPTAMRSEYNRLEVGYGSM